MLRLISIFSLAALLGLIVQATLIKGFMPSAVAPDFLLILIVYLAIRHRSPYGLVGAFALGLLGDFASELYVGPNAVGALAAFGVTAIVAEKIYAETFFARMVLVLSSSIAKSVARLAFLALYLHLSLASSSVLMTLLLEAVISAAISPLVFWALRPARGSHSTSAVPGAMSLRWSQ